MKGDTPATGRHYPIPRFGIALLYGRLYALYPMAPQHAPALPENLTSEGFAFYLTPQDAWKAMLEDCRRAASSIDLEQYIFRPDPMVQAFMELFIAKAKDGVKVRMILDKIGSYELYFSSWVKTLRENGVQLVFYNPITFSQWFRPATWLPRDHTKTLLVDGTVAYTGGVCFDEKMHGWRDTHVRFTGPETKVVQTEIDHLWHGARQGRLTPAHHPPAGNGPFSYVVSAPFFRRSKIYRMLREEISNAAREVCIVTPYFVPPRRFVRLLKRKACQGIRISIIVANRSDVTFADCVAQSYLYKLSKRGIHIFFYEPTTLHAKYFIVDDAWAGVGSTNIDYLSFLRNKEANIVSRDPYIVRSLKEHFTRDLNHSRKYALEDWKNRPLSQRVLGFIGRPLRRFL